MSTGYVGAGGQQPHKVSFEWIGEAWKLFVSSAPVWVSAIIVAVYAPLCIDLFITFAIGLSHKIAGAGTPIHALTHTPAGLTFGLALLNAVFCAFIGGGLAQMALKQARGEAITFRDIFAGGPLFSRMLVFGLVSAVLIGAGSVFFVIPGVFLAGLLIPALALTASGEHVGTAISRSVKTMWPDRWIAMGLAFVLGTVTLIGLGFATIGLLATLPLCFLVSALAHRDMFALPEPQVSLDDILGTVEPGRGVYLSGDAPFSYSPGHPQPRSLSGEPVDAITDTASPPTS